MLQRTIYILTLFASVVYSDAEELVINVKENKLCVSDNDPDVVIKLGNKNSNGVRTCQNKCLNDENCVAMQFKAPRRCSLFYSPIKKMKNTEDEVYCGRVQSAAQSEEVTEKTYNVFEQFSCGEIDKEKATNFKDKFQSQAECQAKCDSVKKCLSYQWNEKNMKCTIIKYRVEVEDLVAFPPKAKKARVCAVVPVPETICNLEVVLKYPYEHPDDAEYFGRSTEYMVINEAGDDYYRCSGEESIYYPAYLPDWCSYENSSPEATADGAVVVNEADDYYDYLEKLYDETIILSKASGKSFDINVYKYFFEQDYYTNYDGWEDHMLAAVLTVKNLSHESQTDLNPPDGWSKAVDINISTHIENADGSWTVNEDYNDHFKVTVSCDDDCLCAAEFYDD